MTVDGHRRASALRQSFAAPPLPEHVVPVERPSDRIAQRRSRMRLTGEKALPRAATPPIALRSIDGHITRTGTQVMAWYRLAPQAWSFRADGVRELLINQIAHQLGELAGRWLHLRVTHRPYPVRDWATAFERNAVGRPADVLGAHGWAEFLRGEERHLAGLAIDDKQVFLGVEITRRGAVEVFLERAGTYLERFLPSLGDRELTALETELTTVDAAVAGNGLDAVRADADDMAWLMHRSARLGLPVDRRRGSSPAGAWATEDLLSFTDGVAMTAEPYDPTLTVHGVDDCRRVERRLAILSLGLMSDLDIPERAQPWMLQTDALPFPVEWSARIFVRKPENVAGELQRQMGKVRSQERHYVEDHGLDPPLALERQADAVRIIEDELSAGLTSVHARLYGWWRIAVSGRDEEEVSRRARAVADLYKPAIAIEHPEGQYQLAREFIPGEPLATTAHRRRGSTLWAAAAAPACTAMVGDDHGILLGETDTASRRPVAWNPWLAQEVRRSSGLTAVVGGLGAGKSFLTGMIVYKTVRAGAHWTVLDPSGPLAALTRLPELAPYARHVNLLAAEPGILNPYRVVAQPQREHFAGEREPEKAWRRELHLADATRRRLAMDVLTGLLPHDVGKLPQTKIAILRAVRAAGGAPDGHLGLVIVALRRHAREGEEQAGIVADFLDERRDLPQAALLFPDGGDGAGVDPWSADADIRLTVLTMQGLSLPRPSSAREEWTDNESLGVELLNLASWLTQRTIYDADRNLRKGVALDETHFLSQVPTGKVLIDRLARDSRKFNVRALFASQLAGDLLRVPGFASLVNAVFVGRTDDPEAQADALRLLKVPTDPDHLALLGTLSPRPRRESGADQSPRQFVFADGDGGVETIRIDLSSDHLAHLRAALDTNPDGRQVRTRDTLVVPPPLLSAPVDDLLAELEVVPTAAAIDLEKRPVS